MSFWLTALGLTLACALLVLLPLRARARPPELDQGAVNTGIFRERLAELDSDRESGRLNESEYRAQRLELERTFLSDMAPGQTGSRAASGPLTIVLAGILAVSVPLAGLSYFYLSGFEGEVRDWRETRDRLGGPVERLMRDPEQPIPDALAGELPNVIRVLMARLQRDGLEDHQGLTLLGTTLLQAGAAEEALDVLDRAYRRNPSSNQLRVALAQAVIMNNDGRLSARSEQLLATVLEDAPSHQGARMLLGFAAFNAGQFEVAADSWRGLLDELDPASEPATLLRDVIARAEAASTAPAPDPVPTDPAAGITVTVDIAEELRPRLQPGMALFVFAREAGGPTVPLAAVRHAADGFPVTVVLDDSTGMLPGRNLSQVRTVEVQARVSSSAQGESGDLEAAPVAVDMASIPTQTRLLIDRIRP